MLSFSCRIAMTQGGEDRHCGIHAGHDVVDGDRHLDWQSLGFARHAAESAHTLGHHVVAGSMRVRTGLAVSRDRTIDAPRKVALEVLIREADLGEQDRKSTSLNS